MNAGYEIALLAKNMSTLRKIDSTKMVPLGHRLMVHKTVPFGALFWCLLQKGTGSAYLFLWKMVC